jgi:hypothetical protein
VAPDIRTAAWREYALHMEWCGECAERIDDCEAGSALRAAAWSSELAAEPPSAPAQGSPDTEAKP